jgi:Zn-dependent protease
MSEDNKNTSSAGGAAGGQSANEPAVPVGAEPRVTVKETESEFIVTFREPGLVTKVMSVPGMKTFLSMVVFAAVFWLSSGKPWMVAVGLTVGLLVHELGHMVVFWYYRMQTTPPVFMPFVGAVISMKEEAPNAYAEAWIGLGGPLAGTAAAFVAYLCYFLTGSDNWLNIALLCFSLNMFNLLPMSPLDGGHITGAMWRGIWVIGTVCIGVLAALTGSTMLMVALLVGFTEINRKLLPLGRLVWVLLFVAIAANGIYWENIWALIPAAFTIMVAKGNFTHRKLMIHVPDRDAEGEAEFQMVYAAMRANKELAGITEDQAREHWTKNFNGKSWSSLSTTMTVDGKNYSLLFVNTGYFDIPLWQRLVIGFIYITLTTLLVYMFIHCLVVLQPDVFGICVEIGLN